MLGNGRGRKRHVGRHERPGANPSAFETAVTTCNNVNSWALRFHAFVDLNYSTLKPVNLKIALIFQRIDS